MRIIIQSFVILAVITFYVTTTIPAFADIAVELPRTIWLEPYAEETKPDINFSTRIAGNPFAPHSDLFINLSVPGPCHYSYILYKLNSNKKEIIKEESEHYSEFGPKYIRVYELDVKNMNKDEISKYILSGNITLYNYDVINKRQSINYNCIGKNMEQEKNISPNKTAHRNISIFEGKAFCRGDINKTYTLRDKNGDTKKFSFEFSIIYDGSYKKPIYNCTIIRNGEKQKIREEYRGGYISPKDYTWETR